MVFATLQLFGCDFHKTEASNQYGEKTGTFLGSKPLLLRTFGKDFIDITVLFCDIITKAWLCFKAWTK